MSPGDPARPAPLAVALLIATAIASHPLPASGEVRVLYTAPFPRVDGVTVYHATHQIAPPEGLYWTRIDLLDVWYPEAAYDYAMFGAAHYGGQVSRGSVVTRDLETCRDLNPWWGSGIDTERPNWCDLWLSTEVFDAVRTGEPTTFQIDSYHRHDRDVHIELVREDVMAVLIDGRTVELPVLVLESTVGDVLWVHDDRDNPYVLRASVEGVYDWYVTEIYVELDAPAIDPNDAPVEFIPTSSVTP